jgi:hypothetical protein
MKNSILVLSIVITFLCGTLIVRKNHQMAELRAHLAAADAARDANAARAAHEEKQAIYLQRRIRQVRDETLIAPKATPAPEPETESQILRRAMIKEMLLEHSKLDAADGIQKLFDAGLAGQLQLNSEQSAALRQLLLLRNSIPREQLLVPMMTGDLNPTSAASAGRAVNQQIADNTAQIQALLGNDGYDTLQSFEKNQAGQTQAGAFASSAATAGLPLTSDQQNKLADVINTERTAFNFQSVIGKLDTSTDTTQMDFEHFPDNFTDANLAAYQQEMGELNGRIVQSAQAVLTADQSAQLSAYLAQQLSQAATVMHNTTTMLTDNAQ